MHIFVLNRNAKHIFYGFDIANLTQQKLLLTMLFKLSLNGWRWCLFCKLTWFYPQHGNYIALQLLTFRSNISTFGCVMWSQKLFHFLFSKIPLARVSFELKTFGCPVDDLHSKLLSFYMGDFLILKRSYCVIIPNIILFIPKRD